MIGILEEDELSSVKVLAFFFFRYDTLNHQLEP